MSFRGFALVGPFVVMIYKMLKKDFLIFFVIYMIFVIGFSQGKRNIMLNQKIALSNFYHSLFFVLFDCFSHVSRGVWI